MSEGGGVEGHRLDELAGVGLAQGEGVVGAEGDVFGAEEVEESAQGGCIVDEGIDVEAGRAAGWTGGGGAREVVAGAPLVGDRAEVRSALEAVLDAADGAGEGAAAVGEGDAEIREALEDAAEDDGADGA